MGKYLLRSTLFCIGILSIIFLMDNVLINGIASYKEGQVGKINSIINHEIDTDIAIFGSSVAWVQFNPEIISSITGKDCFNFGLDGTPLVQYKGVLQEFISYSNSDIVVIAGAFDEFSPREQLYETYKYIAHIENDFIYDSFAKIDPTLVWKIRCIPFYRFTTYNKYFYSYAISGLMNKKSKFAKEEFRGFVPNYEEWPENINYAQEASINVPLDESNIECYKKTIAYLNSKGKQVILVLTPVYIEGQHKIKNLNEIREIFSGLAGGQNIFFDFTKGEICYSKEYFYNNSHLNAAGADLFSKEFSTQLLKVISAPKD